MPGLPESNGTTVHALTFEDLSLLRVPLIHTGIFPPREDDDDRIYRTTNGCSSLSGGISWALQFSHRRTDTTDTTDTFGLCWIGAYLR